jgi:hypothetical protein
MMTAGDEVWQPIERSKGSKKSAARAFGAAVEWDFDVQVAIALASSNEVESCLTKADIESGRRLAAP